MYASAELWILPYTGISVEAHGIIVSASNSLSVTFDPWSSSPLCLSNTLLIRAGTIVLKAYGYYPIIDAGVDAGCCCWWPKCWFRAWFRIYQGKSLLVHWRIPGASSSFTVRPCISYRRLDIQSRHRLLLRDSRPWNSKPDYQSNGQDNSNLPSPDFIGQARTLIDETILNSDCGEGVTEADTCIESPTNRSVPYNESAERLELDFQDSLIVLPQPDSPAALRHRAYCETCDWTLEEVSKFLKENPEGELCICNSISELSENPDWAQNMEVDFAFYV